jgi:DNA-directed RNA polymerase specialized sigma subunit
MNNTRTLPSRTSVEPATFDQAVARLRNQLGRSPRPTEIAGELGTSLDAVVECVARCPAT